MIEQASVTSAAMLTVRTMMWTIRRFSSSRVGLQRELVDDQPGEIVEREEALQQQREQRAEIDDAEPQQRRQQEQRGSGAAAARRRRRRSCRVIPTSPVGCRHVAHAPSSMVTIADPAARAVARRRLA